MKLYLEIETTSELSETFTQSDWEAFGDALRGTLEAIEPGCNYGGLDSTGKHVQWYTPKFTVKVKMGDLI